MYLVYLPDVGRPSEPLIQKYVGRGSSCIADDEEEDQSRNPRRRRAYDGIAGTEDLEVRHDRRVGQRSVELAPRVPRFDEVFCVVGVPAEVREVFTRRSHAVEDLHEDGDSPRRHQGHKLFHRLFGIRRDERGDILIIALRDLRLWQPPVAGFKDSCMRVINRWRGAMGNYRSRGHVNTEVFSPASPDKVLENVAG